MRRAAGNLALLALAGCVVGPDYRTPQVEAPAAFAERTLVPQASTETADLGRWWAQLGDPALDSLIGRALAQNLDLKSAASRLREARTQVTIARAALLPSLTADAVAARRDAQGGAPGAPPAGGVSLPRHLDLYSLGVDANWEIDIFGGARRGIEAAQAQAQAAEWQGRDSQVALTAEVARTYLSLRLAQARKAQAEADVARLRDLADLTAARARAGVAAELDVEQQRQAVAARLAELPQYDMQARAAIHALGVLLGQAPATLQAELAPPRPLPQGPQALPVGLPSDLLRRRPDVRAAERRLAAATAEIGVATADLFPKLDLIALASFASRDFSSLLSRRNFSTVGVGRGTWAFFQGGRGRATVAARREAAQQAELAYRQTVLTSLKEVEDALSAYAADRERETRLVEDLRVAQDTADLAAARYRAGLTPFIDVLQARAAIDAAADQLAAARGARLGDVVTLFTALGGGWS